MTAQECLTAGKPDEALLELQNEIRAKPEDTKLRVFLFQLHCVLGNWNKALTQLQVIAGIDPDTMLLAQVFQAVINCEALRWGVFEGKVTPMIFGEPLEWVGLMLKAALALLEGGRQGEDLCPMLDGDHPPGGKAAAVA